VASRSRLPAVVLALLLVLAGLTTWCGLLMSLQNEFTLAVLERELDGALLHRTLGTTEAPWTFHVLNTTDVTRQLNVQVVSDKGVTS